MILVITHDGQTTEHHLVFEDKPEADEWHDVLLAIAEEVRGLQPGTLSDHVVDVLTSNEDTRHYVRPKVPFGATQPGPGVLDVLSITHNTQVAVLKRQLDIAIDALTQYSTSPTSGDRARVALANIAELDGFIS